MLLLALGCAATPEYASFDGFYHNEHFPDWGALGQPGSRTPLQPHWPRGSLPARRSPPCAAVLTFEFEID